MFLKNLLDRAVTLKRAAKQSCQIFLARTYQNGKNIPNSQKIHQTAIKYGKGR
jgi:hypothetical protein